MTASGRNWFEIYLLVLTVAWASIVWITNSDGETVEALFTTIGKHIWLGGLIISSVIALIGIIMGTITGLLIERAALLLLAGMFGWVGAAFLVLATGVDHLHLIYVAPLLLIAAGVILSRVFQIKSDIERIKKQLGQASTPPVV